MGKRGNHPNNSNILLTLPIATQNAKMSRQEWWLAQQVLIKRNMHKYVGISRCQSLLVEVLVEEVLVEVEVLVEEEVLVVEILVVVVEIFGPRLKTM